MQVENSATEWKLIKASCDIKDQPKTKETIVIEGYEITNKTGYLIYLLSGSKLSMEATGHGDIRIYLADNDDNVGELEQMCLNGEEGWDGCDCDIDCNCNPDPPRHIDYSAHYYLCLIPTPAQELPPPDNINPSMNYRFTITKAQYNTTEYDEPCEDYYSVELVNSDVNTVHKCCMLSDIFQELIDQECIFISASNRDKTFLHHAVNVTITAHERDGITGGLIGLLLITFFISVALTFTCAIITYKVKHQDKCTGGFQFNCFQLTKN